jgi:hypothetical protein
LSTATDERVEDAIQLFTVQNEEGQVDSVVPLRWCISRATAEMIQERQIEDPQLVIVIENGGKEMDRFIVPLEDQMRYISFRRPGTNVVHATIMWPKSNDSVKKVLTKRFDDGTFRVDLLDYEPPRLARLHHRLEQLRRSIDDAYFRGEDEAVRRLEVQMDEANAEIRTLRGREGHEHIIRYGFDSLGRIEGDAQLEVLVPSEMFAREPSRLMSWLGTVHWSSQPRDQCHLRKRALVTVGTGPLVLLLMAVVLASAEIVQLVVIGALLFVGKRNINFGVLKDPLVSPKEAQWGVKPSRWIKRKVTESGGYTHYRDRHVFWFLVNPPMIVVCVGIGVVFYAFTDAAWPIILSGSAVLFFGLAVWIGEMLAGGPLARLNKRREEAVRKLLQEARQRALEERNRELEQLACSGVSREVSLSALPRNRRTVVLRFQNVKAKVCRPFAR